MPMRCWSCQFENPPAMKFCGQCGTQLAQMCPRCGAENQPTFKFCGQCGTTLVAPPPPTIATASDLTQISRPPEAQRQGYTPAAPGREDPALTQRPGGGAPSGYRPVRRYGWLHDPGREVRS